MDPAPGVEQLVDQLKVLLRKALQDTGGVNEIAEGAHLVDDLGLDSLQLLSFLLEVEGTFGVAIDFENLDLGHLASVRTFSQYVEGLVRR